jgi:putative phosphoribosyl transferase
VAAATDWDAPMEIKRVNPSRPDSHEILCHQTGIAQFHLNLREGGPVTDRDALGGDRLERFIGVIYRPQTERWSHYSRAVLARQFDDWIWFDETRAVDALDAPAPSEPAADDLYPSGL